MQPLIRYSSRLLLLWICNCQREYDNYLKKKCFNHHSFSLALNLLLWAPPFLIFNNNNNKKTLINVKHIPSTEKENATAQISPPSE